MGTTTSRATGRVASVEYHGTTLNGNNTWQITFRQDTGYITDGASFVTAPDSSAGLEAQNLREGDEVTLTLNGKGRVVRIDLQGRAS